jgi:hypothetical protein
VDAIYDLLGMHKQSMSRHLWESIGSYWAAYIQQIRTSRNDARHPSSIDAVTVGTVHASLLILLELAELAEQLRNWVANGLQ